MKATIENGEGPTTITTTVEYANEFWDVLCSAARRDGRSLDPIWEHTNEGSNGSSSQTATTPKLSATTKLILTERDDSDGRLYQRFRSCFPLLGVQRVTNADLTGEVWRSLLSLGTGKQENDTAMTLLRLDAHDMFWMSDDSEVSDGVTIVSRAQFLYIEIARLREGIYASTNFRQGLKRWDTKCRGEELLTALGQQDESAALQAAHLLRRQWPYPRPAILKETKALMAVQRGWKSGATESVQCACQELLQYWKDMVDLGKVAIVSQNGSGGNVKQLSALERAGRALSEGQSGFYQQQEQAPLQVLAVQHQKNSRTTTPTITTSLSDLILFSTSSKAAAPNIFQKHGMLVIKGYLKESELVDCKLTASDCLDDLIKQQLTPRGLVLLGDNVIDFDQVSQEGYCVDNRYKVMDSMVAQALGQRLVEQLPRLLNNATSSTKDVQYKLIRGGVVHSFPVKNKSQPNYQPWRRDGSSLFESAVPHEAHCFTVFIPLVDGGVSEFIPGSHSDASCEKVKKELSVEPNGHRLAVTAALDAGSMLVTDSRILHRELPNTSRVECPILYFTMAKSWFQHESEQEGKEKLVATNEKNTNFVGTTNGAPGAVSFRLSRLYELVSGSEIPPETEYGHPHYTTRFDLMLSNMENEASRAANMDAILNFCTSGQQDNMANALIDILRSPHSKALKQDALEEARRQRKEERKVDGSKDWGDEEDFSSFATDLSYVATLYKLTAKLALKESWSLSKLGFSPDQDGVITLLATLKAYSLRETAKVKTARLEEAFTSWWHAGVDRFHLSKVNRSRAPRVVVVFSSIGAGIARPEWSDSLTKLAPSKQMDILHVLDPAFSWYCQDPTCAWNGGEYYYKELKKRIKMYEAVLFLGDAMGAAAALRFSTLANAVLCFSPHIDILHSDAITRPDFTVDLREDFGIELLQTCRETSARILIHYGENCEDDARAVMLLPSRRNIKLVAHNFDGQNLALRLREEGKLQTIIDDAFQAFTTAKFSSQPRPSPSDSLVSTARATKWMPNGSMLGFGGMNQNSVPYEHNIDDALPVFAAQLDVLMLEDGSLMFIHNGEEEIDFTVS